jgi:hypothetical protein
MFPSPDFVQWPAEVRDLFYERERFFIAEGVDPEDARAVALRVARKKALELAVARDVARATEPPDLREARMKARQEETERVNREYAETQSRIRGPRSRTRK